MQHFSSLFPGLSHKKPAIAGTACTGLARREVSPLTAGGFVEELSVFQVVFVNIRAPPGCRSNCKTLEQESAECESGAGQNFGWALI